MTSEPEVCAPAGVPGMDRRRIIQLGSAAVASSSLGASVAAAQGDPNVIFIVADDMGVADLGCYGHPTHRTPNIDKIAAQGARFSQAYANSPVCSASRIALMTGRYQYRLAAGLEEPLRDSRGLGIPLDHPTLPSLFKARGYSTSLIGKWHLGGLPTYGPRQSGYDHFYGFRGGALDYFNHGADFWEDEVPIHKAGYLTDLLGERAVQSIDEATRDRRPFFISLHFNAPHWPWEGPEDESEANRLTGKSIEHFDGGSAATYRAMIERMDYQVGRVLESIDRSGQTNKTIVVFTSDNGGERFAYTWPFTGHKTELLEGGIRIPALIRWPSRIKSGVQIEQTMMHMDWMPTLLAAAGLSGHPSYPSDGMNLLPALAGAPSVARKLFWRYKTNAQRAMRDGDLKVLKIRDNSFVFNVVDDPLERANLKGREPEIYRRLTAEWDRWNAAMLPENPETPTRAYTAAEWASNIGAGLPSEDVDDVSKWPGI